MAEIVGPMSDQQPVSTPDLIRLEVSAADQRAVVATLLEVLEGAGRLLDADAVRDDLMAREAAGSTAIPGGVAIPHARTPGVSSRTVVMLGLTSQIEWSADAPPVDLILALFTPAGDSDGYLTLLASLTRGVVGRLPLDLRAANTRAEASELLVQQVR